MRGDHQASKTTVAIGIGCKKGCSSEAIVALVERAIAAAALWRFRPATADGQPVASAVTIEVSFRLL